MYIRYNAYVLIFWIFFLSINSYAQDYWINTEQLPIPPGVSRLGLDLHSKWYISTGDGNTYYSDNSGQDWQLIKSGLNVTVFLPDSAEYIYFGTNDGIYRSMGALTEWEEKSTGLLYYRHINDLIMDSRDYLYAAVRADGIYRSVDKGENWNFISYSIPLDTWDSIESLTRNSADTLFAGTEEIGVYKSVDHGNNWFYSGMNGLNIECTIGLENNFILLGSFDRGIYRSENNGNYWAWSNSGLPHTFTSYNWIKRLYQASDGIVYLTMSGEGIFKSTDNGVSWQLVSNDSMILDIVDLVVDKENNIIVCGPNGVYFSNDEGNSWNSLNNGLYSNSIGIENVFTGLGNKVFINTRNRILFSEDKGNNWNEWINPVKEIAYTYASADGTIYLFSGSGGYRTSDGVNWTPFSSYGYGYVSDVAENKLGVLYLCTHPEGPIMEMYFGGIYSSSDSGSNWTKIRSDDNSYDAIAVNSNNKIFVGPASGGQGLIVSEDNGESWTTIGKNVINSPAHDILIDFNDHIFVGTDGGVFYSDSDGSTWEKIIQGLETVNIKKIVQNSQGDIFICTQRDVYEFQTKDKSWIKISSGLSGAELGTLAISDDDYLYLGYRENIIARSIHPTVTDLGNFEKDRIATDFYLGPNFPNPFNPRTIISYELPVTNDVELSIYNLLGQKVVTLISERQRAGHHQVEWDASQFSSGIYYYRIETGEFQDMKKMILIK